MTWLISLATVVSLATFVAIVVWAWSGARAPANDKSAMMPFDLPDEPVSNAPRKDEQS